MFWGLFTFLVHSTREPAYTFCNDEQDDLLYSEGPQKEPVLATASTGKTRERLSKQCR